MTSKHQPAQRLYNPIGDAVASDETAWREMCRQGSAALLKRINEYRRKHEGRRDAP